MGCVATSDLIWSGLEIAPGTTALRGICFVVNQPLATTCEPGVLTGMSWAATGTVTVADWWLTLLL